MNDRRELFSSYLAQTSDDPVGLDAESAEGVFITDKNRKRYFDLISGVSVSNAGHANQAIAEAVKKQVESYSHLMVYGEFIQSPQLDYAAFLTSLLPDKLNNVYFVNSGSEAVEGALKLAKRYTGRHKIVAFEKAYHGGTHGALSVTGCEKMRASFRPLLPGITHIKFNSEESLEAICSETACVIVEPVQAEAGVIIPENHYLKKLKKRCDETGSLLIFDEAQTGIGRCGRNFAFEHYGVEPDILILAKALGGGFPLGAFISSKQIMNCLTYNPPLGHITTFGGHPVCCAAGLASFKFLIDHKVIERVLQKGELFRKLLENENITSYRSIGLLAAVELEDALRVKMLIKNGLRKGFITDWFLFNDSSFRLCPPLTITESEIEQACNLIREALHERSIF